MPLARILLLAAAADSLAAGAWAALRPGALFALLQPAPPEPPFVASGDALFLWQVLGLLLVCQSSCLIAAAWRPADCGGLVIVPLSGRLLLCGVWLWLLGTSRVRLPPEPLRGLLLHDAAWLPVFLGFLWVRRGKPAGRSC
jgi:hypothetical protein